YIGYGERYNRYLYRAKVRALRTAVEAHGIEVRGRAVLDLGPGIGFWLRWFESNGATRIAGLEIAEPAVARLRSAFPDAVIGHGSISDPWPFDERFDLITAFDVFYHIVDDDAFRSALVEVSKHLAPGGAFVVTDRMGHAEVCPARHVRFRTNSAYRDALADCGLRVEGVYPVYRLLNGALADSRLIRGSRWLRPVAQRVENLAAPALYLLDHLPLRAPNLRLLVARREGSP
ncbi:MAG TPA: class I SAM-dependent methyltransferase, partial [Longimicrobiales bacterium]